MNSPKQKKKFPQHFLEFRLALCAATTSSEHKMAALLTDKAKQLCSRGSPIRAMFETGARLAKQYGRENVYVSFQPPPPARLSTLTLTRTTTTTTTQHTTDTTSAWVTLRWSRL